MEHFIMSLDAGTTSHRAMIFRHDGSVAAVDQIELPQIYPAPGLVEHDPLVIWNDQLATIKNVLEKSRISPRQIEAIGITNQRETVIGWDKRTGDPIGNAIVWQDRRTANRCRQLAGEGLEDDIREKTGLVIDAYFSATKLEWLMQHNPTCKHLLDGNHLAFGTVDSWLLWKLTGGAVHATDITNASRTMLYDIHRKQWDPGLLRLFRIPENTLPQVRASSAFYGTTHKDLLGSEIPVCGIAGDQQAALFGQLCTRPGMVKNTYGTGCFLMMHTGQQAVQSRHKLLTTIAWEINGVVEYALEGSIFITGALIQWLRDNLGIIDSAPEIEGLAGTVPDNGGVYIVPAFTGLGAPHWDQYARGSIFGLTRGSNKGHIARASLECIALQSGDVLRTMEKDAAIQVHELRADGGASQNDTLMQLQADFIGTTVTRPANTETTAMGAAFLAGLHTGFWADKEELHRIWEVGKSFAPSMASERVQTIQAQWQKALQRSGEWAV